MPHTTEQVIDERIVFGEGNQRLRFLLITVKAILVMDPIVFKYFVQKVYGLYTNHGSLIKS